MVIATLPDRSYRNATELQKFFEVSWNDKPDAHCTYLQWLGGLHHHSIPLHQPHFLKPKESKNLNVFTCGNVYILKTSDYIKSVYCVGCVCVCVCVCVCMGRGGGQMGPLVSLSCTHQIQLLLQVHWLLQHWLSGELCYQRPHRETRASQELKLWRHQTMHKRRTEWEQLGTELQYNMGHKLSEWSHLNMESVLGQQFTYSVQAIEAMCMGIYSTEDI